MAWYSDEEYVFRKDCGEKKSVAASSHKQRTHCGKGGRVKFPSDFMTAKERKAMNGECVIYNLGKPMSFEEWKALPEEFKKEYIVNIRQKFDAPNTAIADMMGCSRKILDLYLVELKLNDGRKSPYNEWDEEGFKKWAYPTEVVEEETTETVVEPEVEPVDISIKPIRWEEFKKLSDEEKINYVKTIRETFGASDTAISKLFAVSQAHFSHVMRKLGLGVGKDKGPKKHEWDQEKFERWAYPFRFEYAYLNPKPKTEVETVAEPESPVVEPSETVCEALEAPVSEDLEVVDIPVVEETEAVQETETVEETESTPRPAMDIDQTSIDRYSLEPFVPCAVPSRGELFFNCPVDQALTTLRMLLGGVNVKLKVEWEVVE